MEDEGRTLKRGGEPGNTGWPWRSFADCSVAFFLGRLDTAPRPKKEGWMWAGVIHQPPPTLRGIRSTSLSLQYLRNAMLSSLQQAASSAYFQSYVSSRSMLARTRQKLSRQERANGPCPYLRGSEVLCALSKLLLHDVALSGSAIPLFPPAKPTDGRQVHGTDQPTDEYPRLPEQVKVSR